MARLLARLESGDMMNMMELVDMIEGQDDL